MDTTTKISLTRLLLLFFGCSFAGTAIGFGIAMLFAVAPASLPMFMIGGALAGCAFAQQVASA